MSIKRIAQVAALSVLLVAGSAAAQTAGSVNVTATPVTSGFSAGTNQNIGSLTLTGVNGGGNVASFPISITAANGGVIGNLSNCQVFNSQGTSLTTGSNVINTIASSGNTFTLNSPLAVSSGTTTLNVRCDIASSTPNGSRFTLSAGTPNLGPVLTVNLDTAPSVPAGSDDVTLANISLGATGASYNVSAIPLTVTTSANGSVANLSDCKIRASGNLDGSLTNAVSIVNGAATTFNFAVPYLVTGAKMLSLTCDVQPATPVGSTFQISVTPANVRAVNAATGVSVAPAGLPAGTQGPNGLPASTSGTVIVSAAGSAPVDPGTGTDTDAPGVPNTGVGSEAGLLALIAIAGIIALFGAFYLGRRQQL